MTSRLSPEAVYDILHPMKQFVMEYQDMMAQQENWVEKPDVYKGMIMPQGWTYLGSGMFRDAFLGPDGWVYKIGNDWSNEREVFNSVALMLESDSSIMFPYAEDVWDFYIIRCEYISGETPSNDYRIMSRLEKHIANVSNYRLNDVHAGNILLLPEGTPVMIDLG